jgi:molybdate transport system regulatory protein
MVRPLSKSRTRQPSAPPRASEEEDRRAALTIRVDFGEHGALGPGKVRLMELISQHGSIAAAGKAMGMSYRRAWLLVDAINQAFREPLIAKQTGGSGGGGARLTKLGRDVVGRYRAIEGAAATASAADLRALRAALATKPRAPQLDDD